MLTIFVGKVFTRLGEAAFNAGLLHLSVWLIKIGVNLQRRPENCVYLYSDKWCRPCKHFEFCLWEDCIREQERQDMREDALRAVLTDMLANVPEGWECPTNCVYSQEKGYCEVCDNL